MIVRELGSELIVKWCTSGILKFNKEISRAYIDIFSKISNSTIQVSDLKITYDKPVGRGGEAVVYRWHQKVDESHHHRAEYRGEEVAVKKLLDIGSYVLPAVLAEATYMRYNFSVVVEFYFE